MSPHNPPPLRKSLPVEDRLRIGIEALGEGPSDAELLRVELRLEHALRAEPAVRVRREPFRVWARFVRPLLIGAVAGTAFAAVPTVKRWVEHTPRPVIQPAKSARSVARPHSGVPVPFGSSAPDAVEPTRRSLGLTADPGPSAAVPEEGGELSLLSRAQSLVAKNPRTTLELVAEHERRFGAHAAFAAEREVLAVEALLRLGGRVQAQDRVRRFREQFPGSAYERRMEMLLENGP